MYTRKTYGTYSPSSKTPYKVSRSKIELFLSCPRCFYMDCRLGLSRPSTPPYTLNNAVDSLLKNEFDLLREKGEKHAIVEKYGINAVPFKHPDLPQWRGEVKAYEGALAVDEKSNLLLNGLVDDIWQNDKGELVIVDYKATSTTKTISLDDEYKQSYKRQMEIYQWLLRGEGHKVSDTGYFVYANGISKGDGFHNKVEFRTNVFPYKGSDKWVEPTLVKIKQTLEGDIPKESPDCEFCAYAKSRTKLTLESIQHSKVNKAK